MSVQEIYLILNILKSTTEITLDVTNAVYRQMTMINALGPIKSKIKAVYIYHKPSIYAVNSCLQQSTCDSHTTCCGICQLLAKCFIVPTVKLCLNQVLIGTQIYAGSAFSDMNFSSYCWIKQLMES